MQINKHGSFYLRNGWPTKIIDAIHDDEHVFSPNNELNAVDSIGVGRVMIKSMRYWASVLGLATEGKDQQGIICTPTHLAEEIAQHDLYCGDRGILWLLHRNLSHDLENATAWSWAFNLYDATSFSKEEFVASFYAYILREGGKYARTAIEKEFDCFKNTYVSDKDFSLEKIIEEDTVPFFAPLKLLEYKGNGQYERRKVTAKEIPADILLSCILLDNADYLTQNKQIDIDLLLEGTNQVSKYMGISYSTLIELLQQLENQGDIKLINNFGNRYIEIQNFDVDTVITNHYQMIGR